MQNLWLTSDEARRYVGCKTMKGWYEWRKRHGVVKRRNNTVNRADLDRALRALAARPRNYVGGGGAHHPSSIANLRKAK
jgi:hypothetical protein